MKLQKPVSDLTPDDLNLYRAHWADDGWAEFASKHRFWLLELGQPNPLYCLPNEIIDYLSRPRKQRGIQLSPRAIEAERDLVQLCDQSGSVVIPDGRLIHYPLLFASPEQNSNESLKVYPPRFWSEAISSNRAVFDRLKGYAGRIVIDPLFQEETRALSTLWHSWPEAERPIFPLSRFICSNDYPVCVWNGTNEQNSFEASFKQFCDKWMITGMATWDLPIPQSPEFPGNKVNIDRHFLRGLATISVPFFYSLQGDDSVVSAVYRYQKKALEKGIDENLAGLGHHKNFGTMLMIAHLEETIRRRYGNGKANSGLVSQLEEAFQEFLGIKEDQVRKLRKGISTCRKGKMEQLKWLQPRVR